MGADKFSGYIFSRRNDLMTEGNNDTQCARIIRKELAAMARKQDIDIEDVPSKQRIYRRIITKVAKHNAPKNPNNLHAIPHVKKSKAHVRKDRRDELIKTHMCDGEIARKIANEESKKRCVDVKPSTIHTWISHGIAAGRLSENPHKGKAEYDIEYIRRERERMIRIDGLSDGVIATILTDKNRYREWKRSRIVEIIVVNVNDEKKLWPRNLNNPEFGDKIAGRDMNEKYRAFVTRAMSVRSVQPRRAVATSS